MNIAGQIQVCTKVTACVSPPTTTKLSPASEKEKESSYSVPYSVLYSALHTLWPISTPSEHTPVIHTMGIQVSRNL